MGYPVGKAGPGATDQEAALMSTSFPPRALHDYALLADGERGALIGPEGDIGWLCAPGWHDDAVFASLIAGLGVYAVTPQARHVCGGYYEEGTLIWRSRWVTGEGVIECREALAFPGDPCRLVLLRQLRAVDGPPLCGSSWTRTRTTAAAFRAVYTAATTASGT
ncbi:trehalase-like domain-containing protein [Streptomyces chiangmaiensis]